MDLKKNVLISRHQKLSLRKNKLKMDVESTKLNRSSDVILIDESFDRLRLNVPKNLQLNPMTFSPIVVNDSSDLSDYDLPTISLTPKTPSKCGNVSFNCSKNTPSPNKDSQPSTAGWSAAQTIIPANPKNSPLPSTPQDIHNKSHEKCTMKTIEKSQKKILNELYGETWKSIPKLFKTISQKYENFDGVTKKLFNDDDEEKENVSKERAKEIHLANAHVNKYWTYNRNESNCGTEKKSKKKLYTEKVPSTPDLRKPRIVRNVNSTTKKTKIKKGMSVTEMVNAIKNDSTNVDGTDVLESRIEHDNLTNTKQTVSKHFKDDIIAGSNVKKENNEAILAKEIILKKRLDEIAINKRRIADRLRKLENDVTITSKDVERNLGSKNVDVLTKQIEDVAITPSNGVKRLSFLASLAENVPTWRMHPEAFQYRDNYNSLKERLSRRLYAQFNKDIFGDAMDADMPILWDSKLRSTAGNTMNVAIKSARGEFRRTSSIKLSTKVVDTPQRLRDTLIHEMCHAATWLIDHAKREGHGPLWKKWVIRSLQVFPELGQISIYHDFQIHYKYTYQCVKCGYAFRRHSKSIDITKKVCGYCRGTFRIVLNKKKKDGVVVATPARKATTNGFALFVKENYASLKDSTKTHAQVMKLLGEQYSARKCRIDDMK